MKPHPFEIMQSASAWTSRECADEYSVSEETWCAWVGDIDMRWLDVDTSNPGVARAVREGWHADFDVAQAVGMSVKGVRHHARAALGKGTLLYGEYEVARAPRGWPGDNIMLRPFRLTQASSQPKPKPKRPAAAEVKSPKPTPRELTGEGWLSARELGAPRGMSPQAVGGAAAQGRIVDGKRIERTPHKVWHNDNMVYMYRWVGADKGHEAVDVETNNLVGRKSPERLAREARWRALVDTGEWFTSAAQARMNGEASARHVTASARHGTATPRGYRYEASDFVQEPETGHTRRLYRALSMTREGNVVEDGERAQAPSKDEAVHRARLKVSAATEVGAQRIKDTDAKLSAAMDAWCEANERDRARTHTRLREAASMAIGVLMCCTKGKHGDAASAALDELWEALSEDMEANK
ncbi:MAG: hypothetical protein CL489_06965 [Acidobacteria bacterium]|nr:hypothetical protein [Acidobacteriota bacterium]